MTRRPVTGVLTRTATVAVATPMVVFLLVTGLLAGDAVTVLTGGRAAPAEVAALRNALGLDRPWWQRLGGWLAGILRGDPGTSLLTGRPVGRLLLERWPTATALLVAALVVVVPLGGLLAWWVGGRPEAAAAIVSTAVAAVPVPVVAVLATTVLTTRVGWLPAVSLVPAADTLWQHPAALVLPALALGIPTAGWVGMVLGGVLRDVRRMPHVQDALVRGVSSRRLAVTEIGPFLLAPVLRVLGLTVGGLLFSSTVVETLFALNGFGELMVGAIGGRDVPVVLAGTLLAALPVLAGFAVADLLAARATPQGRS